MMTMSGIRFCCICDRPITGKAQKIEQFSASGARPDKLRHPHGDPACKSPR